VNMPTRTVVFSSTRKHDGDQFRDLTPGEYTQMSGRAGRRGLDNVGTVIILQWGEFLPDTIDLNTMILGTPKKLESQFRLTYNMILNLLRVQDFKVEDMIRRSFSESLTQKEVTRSVQHLKNAERDFKNLEEITCIYGEPDIENYHSLSSQIVSMNSELQEYIVSQSTSTHLHQGRLLVFSSENYPQAYGVIVKISSQNNQKNLGVFVTTKQRKQGSSNTKNQEYEIVDIPSKNVVTLCKEKFKAEKVVGNSADRLAVSTLIDQITKIQCSISLGFVRYWNRYKFWCTFHKRKVKKYQFGF